MPTFGGPITENQYVTISSSAELAKSGYEPDINPTYHDLARHYGVEVLPARARRPRDKSLVS